MNLLKKTLLLNILILVAYSVFFFITSYPLQHDSELVFVLGMCMSIASHAFVLLIISVYYFIKQNAVKGRNNLFAVILVLLVGFSTCYSGASW